MWCGRRRDVPALRRCPPPSSKPPPPQVRTLLGRSERCPPHRRDGFCCTLITRCIFYQRCVRPPLSPHGVSPFLLFAWAAQFWWLMTLLDDETEQRSVSGVLPAAHLAALLSDNRGICLTLNLYTRRPGTTLHPHACPPARAGIPPMIQNSTGTDLTKSSPA